ncbi:hypothetical protein, partial [uncultured Muribaculum sp.]
HLLCKQGVNGSNPLFSTQEEDIDMLEAILSNQNQDTSETNDEIKALGMHIRCDRLSRRKK